MEFAQGPLRAQLAATKSILGQFSSLMQPYIVNLQFKIAKLWVVLTYSGRVILAEILKADAAGILTRIFNTSLSKLGLKCHWRNFRMTIQEYHVLRGDKVWLKIGLELL